MTEKPSPGPEAGGRWGHLLHVGWLLLRFLKKFRFYSVSAWIFRSILDYKLSWETSRFIAYVKCSRAAVTGGLSASHSKEFSTVSSGGWRSEIRVSAGLVSPGASPGGP